MPDPHDRPDTLLADTRATVARWPGWRVTRSFEDSAGRWGFLARTDRDAFLCVAKRRLHGGRASFMQKAVRRARGKGYVLCEFVGARYANDKPTPDSAFVFDADTVAARGTASAGKSAKGVETAWVEASVARFGVLLGEYVSGRAALPPPGDVPAGQVTLDGVGS